MKWLLLLVFVAALVWTEVSSTRFYRNIIVEDVSPYNVLGVEQNADVRQIKRAFKRLALQLHPDKNPDADAKERFLEVRNAYEFLKDPEVRSLYDRGQLKFQSYTANKQAKTTYYYNYQYHEPDYENPADFNLYDGDPNIIVLKRDDFDDLVRFTKAQWFINFFSPRCFHCRQMVHIWKEIAKEFNGIINIGVFNCMEDVALCREESIPAYPFLRLYPAWERFNGYRTVPELRRFILDRLEGSAYSVDQQYWENVIKTSTKPESWLFFFCGGQYAPGNCMTWDLRKKVAAVLNGHANVGIVDCRNDLNWCKGFSSRIVYWKQDGDQKTGVFYQVKEDTVDGIADAVLGKLPKVKQLSESDLQEVREILEEGKSDPWLVGMGVTAGSEALKILKELPPMLPGVRIGYTESHLEECKCLKDNCRAQFVVFKRGGRFEEYHGEHTTRRIAEFVKSCSLYLNVRSLFSKDLASDKDSLVRQGLWFVFHGVATGSTSLRALSHHRQSSHQFEGRVQFGVVDCSYKNDECGDRPRSCHHASQTPYTVYFQDGAEEVLSGILNPAEIIGFLEDKLEPLVLKYTYEESVNAVQHEGTWIVAYADGKSWCRDFPPYLYQWHSLAQMLVILKDVRVIVVDCLRGQCPDCPRRSGPCVKVHQHGTVISYPYQSCEAHDVRWWFLRRFIMPVSVIIDSEVDWSQKVDGSSAWLIYFSATMRDVCRDPNPAHMQYLDFETVAKAYQSYGAVKFACLNCFTAGAVCSEIYAEEYPAVLLYARGSWLPSQGVKIQATQHEIAKVAAQLTQEFSNELHANHDEL